MSADVIARGLAARAWTERPRVPIALAVLGLAVWGVIHPGVSPSSSETEDEKECTE